jgi:hypothetical protein
MLSSSAFYVLKVRLNGLMARCKWNDKRDYKEDLMRNLFVAFAVFSLLIIPTQKAFGQAANQPNVQIRTQGFEEEARASALLTSLVETYKQLLERESGMTAEEQRQIANTIDQGRLQIPQLAAAVREVYSRFRGDRVFAGASLGIGGEYNFFQNRGVPLLGRAPYLREWATGADGSIGIAAAVIHNQADGSVYPQFSGYYSVGINESRANVTRGTPAARTAKVAAADRAQAYIVWRIYLVPRNVLTSTGVMSASTDPDKTPAHVGNLAGTYIGGGTEHRWRTMAQPTTLQTQVYGRWSMPTRDEEILPQLAPEVIMLQLAPGTKILGRPAPVFAAQGGVQLLGFFGLHSLN